jgi:hypothetical protein
MFVNRGEVANNAIKMAGAEVGLFRDRSEVRVKMDFEDLSDEQLLIRLSCWSAGRGITATMNWHVK